MQLLCFAEGLRVSPVTLLRLALLFSQDMRRIVQTLELWCRRPVVPPSQFIRDLPVITTPSPVVITILDSPSPPTHASKKAAVEMQTPIAAVIEVDAAPSSAATTTPGTVPTPSQGPKKMQRTLEMWCKTSRAVDPAPATAAVNTVAIAEPPTGSSKSKRGKDKSSASSGSNKKEKSAGKGKSAKDTEPQPEMSRPPAATPTPAPRPQAIVVPEVKKPKIAVEPEAAVPAVDVDLSERVCSLVEASLGIRAPSTLPPDYCWYQLQKDIVAGQDPGALHVLQDYVQLPVALTAVTHLHEAPAVFERGCIDTVCSYLEHVSVCDTIRPHYPTATVSAAASWVLTLAVLHVLAFDPACRA